MEKNLIDSIFSYCIHQQEVLMYMYTLALDLIPSTPLPTVDEVQGVWLRIKSIDGWPRISPHTAEYIMGKAQELDKQYHPNVMPGGFWMNSGFSVDETVPDWEVATDGVPVKWMEDK